MSGVPFPFEAYPQQRALMDALYACIDEGRVGLFESPTGTGKSLSVICRCALCAVRRCAHSACSSLHWLQNETARLVSAATPSTSSKGCAAGADDWFSDLCNATAEVDEARDKGARAAQAVRDVNERIAKSVQRLARGCSQGSASFGARVDREESAARAEEEDDAFGLDEYLSEGEGEGESSEDERGEDESGLPQIVYCSRTHSQISQFVSEVRKTAFASVRCVTLGSRRQLCVNRAVNNGSSSDARITEKCLELQKKRKSKSVSKREQGKVSKERADSTPGCVSCEYRCRSSEQTLAHASLAKVRDIEEFVALGREVRACPFYSSRKAVSDAQLICMPYSLLIHAASRAAVGVTSLRNKVVVLDEAHNIVDAVNAGTYALLPMHAAYGMVCR